MLPKIFVDGQDGTTGIEIHHRLQSLPVNILSIDPHRRKDWIFRRDVMKQADLVVLCLPDDASREIVNLLDEFRYVNGYIPKILDASTAFRTHPQWIYGFAELNLGQAEAIATAERVANPGCYATGVIALLAPLRKADLLADDVLLTINAISGYSGGGKTMIEVYKNRKGSDFELYSLGIAHKHLAEIMTFSSLKREPIFVPSVGNFYRGMVISIPIHIDTFSERVTIDALLNVFQHHYKGANWVKIDEGNGTKLSISSYQNQDAIYLHVYHNQMANQVVLVAAFDNLGKGAAGAAEQNIRLMLSIKG